MTKALEAMCWLAGSAGCLIPGFAFFVDPPPLFAGVSLLTGGLAACVLLHGYYKSTKMKNRARRATRCVFIGLTLACAYLVALPFTTVRPPAPREGARYQTGFYKSDWSLTDLGLQLKEQRPTDTPQRWLLAVGGFSEQGPAKVWTAWSIIAAGVMLILLFLSAFVWWTYGFALLAREYRDRVVRLRDAAKKK